MISNSVIGVAAGVCGTLFLGYCIYFDRKRRSDPNFKKMLKERRKAARESANQRPIPKDPADMQRYFLQEIQQGEELLSMGDINNGVTHLCNAIDLCGQPQQLLNVLGTTLPPPVFDLLIQRLNANAQQRQRAAGGPQLILADEDVE